MSDARDKAEMRGSPALAKITDPHWLLWYRLTPQQRWEESSKLFAIYRLLGGYSEPEDEMDDDSFFERTDWVAAYTEWQDELRVRYGER